jgi:hypothetical protein
MTEIKEYEVSVVGWNQRDLVVVYEEVFPLFPD